MVILKVRELAESKGIKNPFVLADRTGLAYANCWKMWNGKQTRINLSTINSLCVALECEPGDFIKFVKITEIRRKK